MQFTRIPLLFHQIFISLTKIFIRYIFYGMAWHSVACTVRRRRGLTIYYANSAGQGRTNENASGLLGYRIQNNFHFLSFTYSCRRTWPSATYRTNTHTHTRSAHLVPAAQCKPFTRTHVRCAMCVCASCLLLLACAAEERNIPFLSPASSGSRRSDLRCCASNRLTARTLAAAVGLPSCTHK